MAARPNWFDGHLDLACLAAAGRDMGLAAEAAGPLPFKGLNGRAALTFPALAEGNVTGVVGAIYVRPRLEDPKGEGVNGAWSYNSEKEAGELAWGQVEIYQHWAKKGVIRLAHEKGGGGGLAVLLMMEGANAMGSVEELRKFYAAGVRIISLAIEMGSKWAGGNRTGGDVTAAGRELVAEMDRLGMVHDVSHLSEKAFWRLLEMTHGPVVATHSNCRALLEGQAENERHLTDEQIRAIAARGGMMGINLFSRFLVTGRRATIADVVKHVRHMVNLAGRSDCLGLGSDMDGLLTADDLPEGLDHPRHLYRLAEALSAAGFSDVEVAGFAEGNWRNYFTRHLGSFA